MANRRLRITDDKIEKMINEGRGAGTFSEYKPWLKVKEIPSRGLSTQPVGWKTNRSHQLFSRLEWHYLLLLEWSPNVIDIREQFPLLPWRKTVAIAQKMGVKYPEDWKTKHALVMTTDFVLTIQTPNGQTTLARTTMYQKDLKNSRIKEKLKIERAFFAARGIDWGLVTEKSIPPALVHNIRWIHKWRNGKWLSMTPETIELVAYEMTLRVIRSSYPLSQLANQCDNDLGLPEGSSMNVVRHLIANRRWLVDMNTKINTDKSLIILNASQLH